MDTAGQQVQKRINKTLEVDPVLHARVKAEAALSLRMLFDFTNEIIEKGLKAIKSKKAA
jgi:hypothetical protein